mmetsp:Transcript_24028/g.49945  ORF Transcript_24028/g.49945 Transcript_24028/m.49945 type:complete len:93 (+) Transcript_24028:94-372(+)
MSHHSSFSTHGLAAPSVNDSSRVLPSTWQSESRMESTVFANHGATVSTADQQQFNATVKCPKSEWSSFTEEQKQQTYRQWEEVCERYSRCVC